MMKTTFFFINLFLATQAFSQTDTVVQQKYIPSVSQHVSILAGYSFWHYHNIEIGVASNTFSTVGHHAYTSAYYVSSEVFIDRNPIIGPKIGGWISGGVGAMALGGSLIYYTDFDQGTLRLRPEIGMGIGAVKLTYGYNIPLANRSFNRINTHVISLHVLFPVYEKKPKK